jgi:hypothetical protein
VERLYTIASLKEVSPCMPLMEKVKRFFSVCRSTRKALVAINTGSATGTLLDNCRLHLHDSNFWRQLQYSELNYLGKLVASYYYTKVEAVCDA